MTVTILYSIWILYTATSLSLFILLASLSILAKWEKAKHDKKIQEMIDNNDYDDEGW